VPWGMLVSWGGLWPGFWGWWCGRVGWVGPEGSRGTVPPSASSPHADVGGPLWCGRPFFCRRDPADPECWTPGQKGPHSATRVPTAPWGVIGVHLYVRPSRDVRCRASRPARFSGLDRGRLVFRNCLLHSPRLPRFVLPSLCAASGPSPPDLFYPTRTSAASATAAAVTTRPCSSRRVRVSSTTALHPRAITPVSAGPDQPRRQLQAWRSSTCRPPLSRPHNARRRQIAADVPWTPRRSGDAASPMTLPDAERSSHPVSRLLSGPARRTSMPTSPAVGSLLDPLPKPPPLHTQTRPGGSGFATPATPVATAADPRVSLPAVLPSFRDDEVEVSCAGVAHLLFV